MDEENNDWKLFGSQLDNNNYVKFYFSLVIIV